jgi:hypothetical protein
MLLFFTRDALWSRSIDERRIGDGLPLLPLPPYRLFSVLVLRFCQKSRGDDAFASTGEDWNGDEPESRFSF